MQGLGGGVEGRELPGYSNCGLDDFLQTFDLTNCRSKVGDGGTTSVIFYAGLLASTIAHKRATYSILLLSPGGP